MTNSLPTGSSDCNPPKTACSSGSASARKTFFVVEPGAGLGDVPVKYYDQVPATVRSVMRWGYRLDDPAVAALSCAKLYGIYRQFVERGELPASNILPNEFWVR